MNEKIIALIVAGTVTVSASVALAISKVKARSHKNQGQNANADENETDQTMLQEDVPVSEGETPEIAEPAEASSTSDAKENWQTSDNYDPNSVSVTEDLI